VAASPIADRAPAGALTRLRRHAPAPRGMDDHTSGQAACRSARVPTRARLVAA